MSNAKAEFIPGFPENCFFLESSNDMQFHHLAEMKAKDGQGNCHWEQTWAPEQCPEKKTPVLDPFDATDAQLVNGSTKSQDILQFQFYPNPGWLVFS